MRRQNVYRIMLCFITIIPYTAGIKFSSTSILLYLQIDGPEFAFGAGVGSGAGSGSHGHCTGSGAGQPQTLKQVDRVRSTWLWPNTTTVLC